jgi:hypothetical protein
VGGRVGWDRYGWLVVEGRSEPALGGSRGPGGWALVGTGLAEQAGVMVGTVTINEVLDGHVVLDVECLDRIYLVRK